MPEKKSLSDTRGNSLGILFFLGVLKLFGLKHACRMVWMVSFFYAAFDFRAHRSALPYVRHRFPDAGFFRSFFHVWALFTSQGQAIVEQYAVHLGKLRLERENHDLYREAETEHHSFMIAFSHFGPWQAMLSGVNVSRKPVNILMKPDLNRNVDKFSAVPEDPETSGIKVISVEDPMGGILEAVAALEKGEAVGIMADRRFEEKGVPVRFLGEEAMFPTAGFFIAARCGSPVICIFPHRTDRHEVFTAEFGPLIRPVMEGRNRESLRGFVQEYASRLEEMCMKYPYECYIFEDIWKK